MLRNYTVTFHPLTLLPSAADETHTMKITHTIAIAALLSATTLLTACETTSNTSTFSANQAGRAQTVQMGTVTAVRDVTIQSGPSRVGTATGAVLGGIAGSTLGSGNRANAAGAVVGAVAGGAAGNAITNTSSGGVEVTVRLANNNQLMSVVQAGSSNDFRVGDAVRVTSDGSTTRVIRN
jgi:outer membrane lipoprotein SlyB